MHEVFLQRLAAHPTLRSDVNFKVFLEYDQDVSIIYWYAPARMLNNTFDVMRNGNFIHLI